MLNRAEEEEKCKQLSVSSSKYAADLLSVNKCCSSSTPKSIAVSPNARKVRGGFACSKNLLCPGGEETSLLSNYRMASE